MLCDLAVVLRNGLCRVFFVFFFSSRRRHTRFDCDWSSDVCSSDLLAEELEALDMSAAELARKINVPTNRITQILNGTRTITGDTAQRLAHFFGTSEIGRASCRERV